jgi:hypothetical protein
LSSHLCGFHQHLIHQFQSWQQPLPLCLGDNFSPVLFTFNTILCCLVFIHSICHFFLMHSIMLCCNRNLKYVGSVLYCCRSFEGKNKRACCAGWRQSIGTDKMDKPRLQESWSAVLVQF